MLTHFEYEIDIFSERGEVVGTKKRKEIDRMNDILPMVAVFVCTPEKKILIGEVSKKGDPTWQNMDNGKLGYPSCTFVRHGEDEIGAAQRSLEHDLYIKNAPAELLGKGFVKFSDGMRRIAIVFSCVIPQPTAFNPDEMSALHAWTRQELEEAAKDPSRFKPSFLFLWGKYKDRLPL